MNAVILCGGSGTRFSEETHNKPKPMIKINRVPILEYIVKTYIDQGIDEIILLLGYKGKIIREYFNKTKFKNKIKYIDTGKKTLTAERILKAKKYLINEENFMATYGDGLININLNNLLNFHLKHKKVATLTAVRPISSFGELNIKKNNLIKNFEEKSRENSRWINGGFFVFKRSIFKYLLKNQMLERRPMEKLVKNKNLMAYKHWGFWQCMDSKKDKDLLEKILKKNTRLLKFKASKK